MFEINLYLPFSFIYKNVSDRKLSTAKRRKKENKYFMNSGSQNTASSPF